MVSKNNFNWHIHFSLLFSSHANSNRSGQKGIE